ncbi:hypothetical protein [Nostoc sp. 'Lobaria pulmonaria (5183) cyanobiont']|uniref:hypothetical protein n=1 Tax=Nostoc sp. 'Lobaria pulmonaria (5183) cyanobiont' TaxID=1618022 RepID=UPI000CF35157|nr:hypothetical protein [Nostoc sp. 'Lobaria pulmonaria (5183) cyanobiont']
MALKDLTVVSHDIQTNHFLKVVEIAILATAYLHGNAFIPSVTATVIILTYSSYRMVKVEKIESIS